ncbi:MAG TPA: hypothetical protein VK468_08910 [Pyrinomonadaceae bacterium]|nr:hypothetical protein [Pyrinomonadaceae bacterium]
MDKFISAFDERFRAIYRTSLDLLENVPAELLFRRPRELDRALVMFSIGEYLIRSGAVVEQVIGGITTRMWDDPFEWTLPEQLNTPELVADYLAEVEAARSKGFLFLATDADLGRSIPAPEKLHTIFELLTDAASRASHFQGRAFGIFQVLVDVKLPSV